MQFTVAQKNRLQELGSEACVEQIFSSADERNSCFLKLEKEVLHKNKNELLQLKQQNLRPFVKELEQEISSYLRDLGFVEVFTPQFISRDDLKKMSIGDEHELQNQVFWLDDKTCLRPMLAPNLYEVSNNLLRHYSSPLGVFEIGSCFRKESLGRKHLEEFTMVNFVEWGVDEENKVDRLRELATEFFSYIGIDSIEIIEETSTVYGKTIDFVYGNLELASASFGPHPLDNNWNYHGTWLGLGAGLERLAMVKHELNTIQKSGRNIQFLRGTSLKFK